MHAAPRAEVRPLRADRRQSRRRGQPLKRLQLPGGPAMPPMPQCAGARRRRRRTVRNSGYRAGALSQISRVMSQICGRRGKSSNRPRNPFALSDVPAPFRVEVRPERERILVAPLGELDLSTVDELQTELEDALAADWRTVVLDLRGVSFVDSTGLGLLLRAHERFQEQGVDFAIIEGGSVRRLLELAGVSHIFKRASPRRT